MHCGKCNKEIIGKMPALIHDSVGTLRILTDTVKFAARYSITPDYVRVQCFKVITIAIMLGWMVQSTVLLPSQL